MHAYNWSMITDVTVNPDTLADPAMLRSISAKPILVNMEEFALTQTLGLNANALEDSAENYASTPRFCATVPRARTTAYADLRIAATRAHVNEEPQDLTVNTTLWMNVPVPRV